MATEDDDARAVAEQLIGQVTTAKMPIENAMVANTQQIRRIAATAVQLNLPCALDFRINTMLDQGGLHTLLLDQIATSKPSDEYDSTEGAVLGHLILRCLVYYKLVGLTPSQPIAGQLSVRFRDYIRLATPNGSQTPELKRARIYVEPDHLSPEPPDPAQVSLQYPAFRQIPGVL